MTDLWQEKTAVVRMALKELYKRCGPSNIVDSCLALSIALEYSGVVSLLLAMETLYKEDPSIYFFGCLALERFLLVATIDHT